MQVIDKTIAGLLEEIAAENPLREAIIHTEMGVRYNFKHLSREIDRSARGFIKKGISSSDKVALWAHNTPEWLLSFLGLTKIGAITVPIDPNATSENLHFILEQSESRGLIISADSGDKKFAEMALAAKKEIPSLEFIFVFGTQPSEEMTTWTELSALADEVDDSVLIEKAKAVHAEDPMAIMYTSGTTGQPKGVVLDHLGLINKSMVSTERQGITAEDRLCLFFPLFHMFGSLSYNVTEEDLRNAFEAFGQVASATVIKDEQSGRSKGFGFVEMPFQAEAQSATAALNGQAFKGRTLTVNKARPQSDDRRGRDRGGGGDRRGRGRY